LFSKIRKLSTKPSYVYATLLPQRGWLLLTCLQEWQIEKEVIRRFAIFRSTTGRVAKCIQNREEKAKKIKAESAALWKVRFRATIMAFSTMLTDI